MLLEANEVGEGASGRNSGFAIDLPHNVGSSMEELEGSYRFMALARAAIDYHDLQINRHNIECDWERSGKYHTAVSEQGVSEVLEPFSKELNALEEPWQWVEGEELRRRLGSDHYTAAVYTPGCYLMNPAALTRGLADSLPDNVELYEHSPVVSVDYGEKIRVATTGGGVTAQAAVLCVNGYAEQFGFFRNRLLNFAANCSITRPLTGQEQRALGCTKPWGLTPANAFAGVTMRYTRDHRLLVRQDIHYNPQMRESDKFRRRVATNHKRLFDQRFPMLSEVNMEYTWTGYICLSRNDSPGFGRLADNVYAAVCQNAVGVTKGTIGGVLVADMACGEDNELIGYMESLGQPDKLPPRPFLDIGVKTKFAWELYRARHEA